MAEEDTLLREVDEAVRHDELVKLVRRYRKPVLIAATLLILATAGHGVWQSYADKRGAETFAQLSKAQAQYEHGAYDDAANGFAAVASNALSGDAKDMAHLWQGRALAKAGKDDEATQVFDALASHPAGHAAIWRDLACLRLVGLDDKKTACLSAGGDSPLKAQRDLLRAAALWQDGKTDEAASLLKKLGDDAETPPPTKAMAQRLATAMTKG